MAEIFSISGAGYSGYNGHAGGHVFGLGTQCPPGWEATPNGNCGAPASGCPSSARVGKACRSPKALALQTAVAALGRVVKDSALASLGADGFIGAGTVAAVNRVFTAHIGAGQASARFRTGTLTIAQVAADAEILTGMIGSEVLRRGGKLPSPVVKPPPTPPTPRPPTPLPTPPPLVVVGGLPNKIWALVGLSAVAAAAGLYLVYAGTDGAGSTRQAVQQRRQWQSRYVEA